MMQRSFAVVGAGAIGSIVGAHLIDGGHDVTFIDTNEEHVRTVRASGLTLRGYCELTVHPQILLPSEVHQEIDVLLVAVKAMHTLDAVRPVEKLLAPTGFVVSLQNDLAVERLAKVFGVDRTIAALMTFGGFYEGPGHVLYNGPGSFIVGEMGGAISARLENLAGALSHLQPVQCSDNILGHIWGKMALSGVYIATALIGDRVPTIYRNEDARHRLGLLAGEVARVAETVGVRCEVIDGFDPRAFLNASDDDGRRASSWAAQIAYWNRHNNGGQRTGVWRDLAIRKRKTEADAHLGHIIQLARTNGVRAVGLEKLLQLVHEAEQGTRELGWHNLDELTTL